MASLTPQWGQNSAAGELYTILNNFNQMPMDATITVGAEDGNNVINVAIQLSDWNGDDLTSAGSVMAYLASDSSGLDISTRSDLDSEPAIGTDGSLDVMLSKTAFTLTSEADGDIDINFTDTNANNTFYLVVVPATGKLVVSDAITFENG